MAIFEINGRRVLFIHIPKCGGTSVSDFLDGQAHRRFDSKINIYGRTIRPRHLHAAILEQIYFHGMFDYVFTVVRNPFSRIISEYSYQTRKSGPRWQRVIGFDRWLRMSLARASRNPSYRENHFRPQSDFVAFDCEVFRIEDGLDALSRSLAEKVGLKSSREIQWLNASEKRRLIQFSDAQTKLILDTYQSDFDTFGYSRTAPETEVTR